MLNLSGKLFLCGDNNYEYKTVTHNIYAKWWGENDKSQFQEPSELFNMMSNDGWELVISETVSMTGPFIKTVEYVFKRKRVKQ